MISRILRALVCLTLLLGSVTSAQQVPSLPLNDTLPTLSLPPLPKLNGDKPAPSAPAATVPKKTATPPPANSASSTTGDGQFIIRGADLATRTWFSTQCETIASDLRKLLHDPASWSIPIVISVRTPPNISLTEQAVVMNVTPLAPSGFQLQITVQMRQDFNSNAFRTELIRVLLAERILRGHDQLTSTRRPVLPEWFFTGVHEALRYRERARPSATFAAVFKTGRVFGIEEILGAAPASLDALSRTIYETSSCALVLMLLDQPEGNLRMAKFLSALAVDSRSDREVLIQWFPGIAQSKTSLDKWWSLQMAHMSRPSVWETLDPQETAKALDLALAFHYETEVDVSESPPKPRSKAEASEDEEEPKGEEAPRTFFGRLFGASDKSKEESEKPKPKPEPEKKPPPKPDARPGQPGLLDRLFGGDDKPKEAKKGEKKAGPKKEAPKKEAPAKKEESPSSQGLLRRLFSGDKDKAKDETKGTKKADVEKKDDESAFHAAPALLRLAADLSLPNASALFDAGQLVFTPSSRAVILGFGKKKDDKTREAEKKAEDEKKLAEARKKADARKAEEARREEEAKQAAAKKAAAKKEKEDKKMSETDAEKKPEPEEPPPPPKPVTRKRKVIASIPVEEYAKILKRPDARSIIAATVTDLSTLAQRSHPLFVPIINDYITLVAQVASGAVKDADVQFKALRERTAATLKQARAAQDHVDWFEASENNKWSGTFDDYLRVRDTINQELPKRADPLSRLLDEAEKQPVAK